MDDNEMKRMMMKVDFFMSQNIKVHIMLNNKTFYNGYITDKISNEIYRLEEKKLGRINLFLMDIYTISEYNHGGCKDD